MFMVRIIRSSGQRGFTLLEAIVALAILAVSALALYAWLNSSLIILKRVDDVYRTAANYSNHKHRGGLSSVV
jgi:prepilin-type N-terminal cleavage/methylation domain-containing protein